MYFTEVKEAPKFYKKTKLFSLLSDFRDSGFKHAKLEDWKYSRPRCGASAINESAKKFKFEGIHAYTRRGEIYLVNENLQ